MTRDHYLRLNGPHFISSVGQCTLKTSVQNCGKVHSRIEKVAGEVFNAASRLNCGLFMPSGPTDSTADAFFMETHNQLLARKEFIEMNKTSCLL